MRKLLNKKVNKNWVYVAMLTGYVIGSLLSNILPEYNPDNVTNKNNIRKKNTKLAKMLDNYSPAKMVMYIPKN